MTLATSEIESKYWWLVLLQGIAALILGLLLITNTAITLITLVIFIGIYWLIDGVFSIVRIFLSGSEVHWGWLLAKGILGILAGLYVVRHPLWATLLVPTVLVFILGIQGVIMGGISLFQAFKGGGWGVGILGAINIIFGLILLFNAFLAATVLPLVVGIFALVGGVVAIVQAFRIRK